MIDTRLILLLLDLELLGYCLMRLALVFADDRLR